MQILADVLGVAILRMEGSPGAGLGMAMLAAYAAGETQFNTVFNRPGSDTQAADAGQYFHPDPERTLLYEALYQRYLKIHDALKLVF